jgi:hypothetical protein
MSKSDKKYKLCISFWDKFDRKAATIAKFPNLNLFIIIIIFHAISGADPGFQVRGGALKKIE